VAFIRRQLPAMAGTKTATQIKCKLWRGHNTVFGGGLIRKQVPARFCNSNENWRTDPSASAALQFVSWRVFESLGWTQDITKIK